MISRVVRSSRLASWGALVALCAACQGTPDIETLRTTVIAEVPGAKLTGADLERWLMASPEPPMMYTASILTSTWIDEALFAEALRQGIQVENPAIVDTVIQTDLTMATIGGYFARRGAAYPAVTDAQADSLFQSNNIRVYQQLVLNVLPVDNEDARVAAERKATDLRARVETEGVSFTDLIRQFSDEPDAKANGGIMPAAGRDQLPDGQLGGHLWSLRPGDFSRVFSSGQSARLFRRLQPNEAREALKRWLAPVYARRLDAALSDSIFTASGIKLTDDALARARAMFEEPILLQGTEPLVTWTGGQATPAQARNWIMVMDAPSRVAMVTAGDADVEQFVRSVAQRDILLTMARPVVPDSAPRTNLHASYLRVLASLKPAFLRNGAVPAAETPTQLMDSLTIALKNFEPIPRGLAAYLRERMEVKVDTLARRQLLETVAFQYAKQHADSTRGVP